MIAAVLESLANIADHPWQALAALLLAWWGPIVIRRGGAALLISLAIAGGMCLYNWLIAVGILPADPWGVLVCAVFVLITLWYALRHPVFGRNAEILFVVLVCLLGDAALIAAGLAWPAWAIWLVMVSGAVLWPQMTVAAVSAALTGYTLEITNPLQGIVAFTGVLLLMALQHGRFEPKRSWDSRLTLRRRKNRRRHLLPAAASHPAETQLAIFQCGTDRELDLVVRQLRRKSVRVKRLRVANAAAARLPRSVLRRWFFGRLFSLMEVVPARVYAGSSPVRLVPSDTTRRSRQLSLNDIDRLIRTDGQTTVHPEVARGDGLTVAVIGSGVNPVTPKLKAQVIERLSVRDDRSVDDLNGHETSVAAIYTLTHSRIISIAISDADGMSDLYSLLSAYDLVRKIRKRTRIDLLNQSFGLPERQDAVVKLIESALDRLQIPSVSAIGRTDGLYAIDDGTAVVPFRWEGSPERAPTDRSLTFLRLSLNRGSTGGASHAGVDAMPILPW